MMLESFILAVESLRGHLWTPAAFVALYSLTCLIHPFSLFPIAGGVLFGFWPGLFLNLTSAVLGASGSFYMSRRFGYGLVRKFFGDRLSFFDSLLDRGGFRTLLVIRLAGFPPFLVTNYLAGLSKVSWKSFLAATLLGILPWTVVMTLFAHVLWEILITQGMTGFREAVAAYRWPLLGVAAFFIGTIFLNAWWGRSKKAESLKRPS